MSSMAPPIVLAMTGASGAPYAVRLLEVLLTTGRDVHLAISPSAQTVLFQELGLRVSLDQFAPSQLFHTPDGQHWSARWSDRSAGGSSHFMTRSGAASPRMDAQHVKRRETPPREPEPPAPEFGSLGSGAGDGRVVYHHYKDFMTPIASGSHLTAGMVVCPCSGGTLSSIVTGASGNLIERSAEVHLKERRKLVLVPRETPLSLGYLRNLEQATLAGAIVLPAMPGWYHGVHHVLDLVDFVVARVLDQFGISHQLMRRWGDERTDVLVPGAGEWHRGADG